MNYTTCEQAIEIVESLSPEDRKRFSGWFKEYRRLHATQRQLRSLYDKDIARFKQAQDWVAKNCEQFMRQWVCLDGDKLIAHGADALQVHSQAKAAGINTPFLEYIVEATEPFFAGWE